MKLKNVDLIKSGPALDMLGKLHLPVSASMSLAKFLRQATIATEDYERIRVKLVEKHCRKDEKGQTVKIRNATNGQMEGDFMVPKTDASGAAVVPEVLEDNRPAFEADLKELLDGEVDIVGEPMKVETLGNINLPGNVLASLFWLVVE